MTTCFLVKGEGFAVDASLIRANASEARAVDKGDLLIGLIQK